MYSTCSSCKWPELKSAGQQNECFLHNNAYKDLPAMLQLYKRVCILADSQLLQVAHLHLLVSHPWSPASFPPSSLLSASSLDPPRQASLPSFLVSEHIFNCCVSGWAHTSARVFIDSSSLRPPLLLPCASLAPQPTDACGVGFLGNLTTL
jgi:hypothetical protein